MSLSQRDTIRSFYQNDPSFANGNGNNRVTLPLNNRIVGYSSLTKCANTNATRGLLINVGTETNRNLDKSVGLYIIRLLISYVFLLF